MPRARRRPQLPSRPARACAREQGKGQPPMADEAQTIRSINWREVFPFTNLFKAFRVAVHPSKLVLALTALLAIYFGGRILDVCWPAKHMVQPESVMWQPNPHGTAASPRGVFI